MLQDGKVQVSERPAKFHPTLWVHSEQICGWQRMAQPEGRTVVT